MPLLEPEKYGLQKREILFAKKRNVVCTKEKYGMQKKRNVVYRISDILVHFLNLRNKVN